MKKTRPSGKKPTAKKPAAAAGEDTTTVLEAPPPPPPPPARTREPEPPSPSPAVAAMAEAAGPEAAEELEEVEERDPLADFFVSEEERARSEASFIADAPLAATQVWSARGVAELLAFWVTDEEYALPIVDIQEIIKLPVITEVPRVDASVLGIISLRGTIVPVLDLRGILQLERRPVTRQSRILVLRAGGDPVGLLVDRVTSVVRLESDAIEPTPRSMQHHAHELLKGVGRIGQRLIIVLDVAAVLNVMEPTA